MSSAHSSTLFAPPPASASPGHTRVRINADVHLDEEDGLCVVWVHGSPWHRFAARNRLDRRIVGVSLVLAGLAKCAEVERGFGLNHDTLYQDKKRMTEGGIPALARLKSGPKGATKATPALRARARKYWGAGFSKRAIARKLGVSRETARRMLKDIPGREPEPTQLSLLLVEKADEPAQADEEEAITTAGGAAVEGEQAEKGGTTEGDSVEVDEDTAAGENSAKSEDLSAFVPAVPHPQETTAQDLDRTAERVFARFGLLLDEADVRFVSGDNLEVNGRTGSYMLRDGVARFGVGMQFRQVVRREPDGHQIAILTSRKDLAAAEVVFHLGQRWRQENYFKYARDEFALDALDSYNVEPEDPDRTVPNPKRKPFDKKISALRKEATKLEAELGRAADANEESRRPTTSGFKIAHGKLRQELAKVREKIETLVAQRKKLPQRVTIAEASADEGVLLEVEHKHFMNAVKMAVYRAETSLLRMLDPHYRRNEDEGRKLLREAFQSSGSLEVVDGELCVTLNPLSAPRRTRAIAALCDELSAARVRIPGTTLRLKFGVSRRTGVSELAMGPCQEV